MICGLSGGVDSSVVAALLHRAIGDQLTCVFVDHGMLRLDEAEQVVHVFRDQFHVDLVHVEAEERYLTLLAGVTDPEHKRRIIGEEFWKVFFEEATTLEGVKFLAQGTLYPDVIESGNKTAAKIKSHHNLIPVPRRRALRPHRAARGAVQGRGARRGRRARVCPMRSSTASRSRDPGSPCASSARSRTRSSRCCVAADAIVREEIGAWDTDREVWQYFAVLPDIRSVGVMGDERTYGHPIIIRAVCLGRRDDRRLGAPAARPARQDEQPHHQRGRGHQPCGVRHHEQAAGHDRVGVDAGSAASRSSRTASTQ